jgi:hypothetical protein
MFGMVVSSGVGCELGKTDLNDGLQVSAGDGAVVQSLLLFKGDDADAAPTDVAIGLSVVQDEDGRGLSAVGEVVHGVSSKKGKGQAGLVSSALIKVSTIHS